MGLLGAFFGVRLVKRAIRLAALATVVGVAYLLVTAAQVWLTSRHFDPHRAQAAVVMGSAQYDGVPSPDLQARLSTALALFRQGLVPLVVVTGSKQPGDLYTEAQASEAWLMDHGVPASRIVEVEGGDSWQNLEEAAAVLHARKDTEVLVVTDGFHEDRSMAIASDLGLDPSPVPATSSPIRGWSAVPYFAKEACAVAAGRIIGYGNLDRFRFLE